MIKKVLSGILAVALVACSLVFASAETTKAQGGINRVKCNDYVNGLVNSSNFGYAKMVDKIKSDVPVQLALGLADKFIDTGTAPDEKTYTDVLVNIMVTSDLAYASELKNQYMISNRKNVKSYVKDFAGMAEKSISVILHENSGITKFDDEISTAVDALSTLIDSTDNLIESLSNLQTVMQDYSDYDQFLALVENKSSGALNLAANKLRTAMSNATKTRLNSYIDLDNKNFEQWTENYYDDLLFSAIKGTEEYKTDDTTKFFVDESENLLSNISYLKDSWELGTLIGKTIGNITVGGEDMIMRLHEMFAVKEISDILGEEVIDAKYYGDCELTTYETFKSYVKYLANCRIRGEYCVYSIIAVDSGLLKWANYDSVQKAEEWYKSQASSIENVRNKITNTMNMGGIKFTVTDSKSKKPIKSATVLIKLGDSELEYSSDKDGNVYVETFAFGSTKLKITADGYKDLEKDILVEPTVCNDFGTISLEAKPKKSNSNSKPKNDNSSNGSSNSSSSKSDWKQLYIEYIQNTTYFDSFSLIYLNDDDIPEIVGRGVDVATGTQIFWINNSKVINHNLGYGPMEYYDRGGLVHGNHMYGGRYNDGVYNFANGDLLRLYTSYAMMNEEGQFIYRDQDGNEIDKDQYFEELNKVFDSSRAVSPDVWYSEDEIIQMIRDY